MALTTEIRQVPGYEEYTVSSDGAVYGQKGQLLKLDETKGGYLRFRPIVNGRMHMMLVHRAVALAFLPPPDDPSKRFVAHGDGNPKNNHVENLRWVTYEENWEDRRRHGNGGLGASNGRARVTESDVRELRKLYAQGGCTYKELAIRFGISHAQACKIGKGDFWKHII